MGQIRIQQTQPCVEGRMVGTQDIHLHPYRDRSQVFMNYQCGKLNNIS